MHRAGAEGGSVLYELRRPTVDAALGFARDLFRGDASGHDWFHTLRVYKTAMAIRDVEGGDAEVVALAAILHDADDPKLFSGSGYPNARAFLAGHPKSEEILGAIATVSFKGTGSARPNTLEGMIVQDADRLDAIGAIGVARAFAYGGSRGRTMHDPDAPVRETMTEAEYRASESTTVNHFHEKLFKLKSLMNTAEGKRRAEGRDLYMRAFLDQFLREWDGEA
jgi:uncharacterized protein